MRMAHGWFNNYLTGLLLALAVGCASPEKKESRKEAATLRLYLESEFDSGDKTTLVSVVRSNPMTVRIGKDPVLDEAHIVQASVVDTMGGFAILVKYDFHGTLVLENVSNSYRGSRVAIYSMFTEGRWLAAPQVTTRITDGILVFTPDASREETERIVRGLNNVAGKLGNAPKTNKADQPR
ncbi:MAG: hypothetical protein ACYDC1_13780 [Limisphaerales bacterium]